MSLQSRIRPWMPPALLQIVSQLRHGRSGLVGLYPHRENASARATGYDSDAIFDRVTAATEAAIASNGRLFDRDSVVFDYPVTPFPLLTCLLRAAYSSDALNVIDFGGALGSTYRQCRPYLSHFTSVRWRVVEQRHIAERGRERFSTENLRFFDNIAEAKFRTPPHAVIFSSVLQYLDDPFSVLKQAAALEPLAIVVDRTPHSDLTEDMFSVEVVPPSIYRAHLACRIFGAQTIEAALASSYRKFADFDSIDPDMMAESLPVRWSGMCFERAQSGPARQQSANLAAGSE